jgi:preprotein translocase subunit SecA
LIERLVLLRTIDSIWVEHLTELDELRQGIFLRGFAQEEPLNAFKKEAYSLFEEMTALIRHQVATTIFRVSLVRQPAPQAAGEADGAGNTEGAGSTEAAGGSTTEVSAAASFAAGAAAMQARVSQTSADGRSGVATAGRPIPRPLPAGRPIGGSGNGSSSAGAGAVRPGYTPAGVRIGRNDQCYCGSGKKYKKCHGS